MALHFPNTIHCTHKESKRMGEATGSLGRNHSPDQKLGLAALSCPRWSCLGTGRQRNKKTKSPRGAIVTELKIAFIKLWRWLSGWSACCISTKTWVQILRSWSTSPSPTCMCPVSTQAFACRNTDTDTHTHTCMLVHTQLTKLDIISICLELQMQCVFICTFVALGIWAYYNTYMSAVTKLKRFHSWQT